MEEGLDDHERLGDLAVAVGPDPSGAGLTARFPA